MVKATVTVFTTPAPLKVTCPVYVPAFSPVADGRTWRVEGAVPEFADSVSQG